MPTCTTTNNLFGITVLIKIARRFRQERFPPPTSPTRLLDASDLIYSFSDGVDDDGNGFADDIAGWDFFQNDNDPYTSYFEGFGDHGGG